MAFSFAACSRFVVFFGESYPHTDYISNLSCGTTVKEIGKWLVPVYEEKIRKKKGDWLKKGLCVLCKETRVDLSMVTDDIAVFHNLIELRNCVVHSWGKVSDSPKPEKDTTFI